MGCLKFGHFFRQTAIQTGFSYDLLLLLLLL